MECASGTESDGGGGGSKPAGTGNADPGGVCANTCPKECATDADCDTSQGELCCSFGAAGSTCLPAAACPRFCEDDTDCDSAAGFACLRPTLATKDRICMEPEDALQLCGGGGSCSEGTVCCPIYDEPICVPPEYCPRACAQSAECNTQNEEICCTSYKLRDASLAAEGLCVVPSEQDCPKPCDQSSECDTQNGELCCKGLCSKTCPKSCETSSDCTGQICCKSASLDSPILAGTLLYEAPCITCADVLQYGPAGAACAGSAGRIENLLDCACGAACGAACAGFCGVGANGDCAGCLDSLCQYEASSCAEDT